VAAPGLRRGRQLTEARKKKDGRGEVGPRSHCLAAFRPGLGVFSSPPIKKMVFDSLFCKMKLNTMQFFLGKRWLFSILDFSLKRQ
jgi:hypothetical protein